MSSPARGVLRLTRATVLGGATVGLSLAAHLAGGGLCPTPVGLALLSVPVLAATLAVTGRRLSGPGVAALVGTGQVGLHLGLTTLTSPDSAADANGAPTAGAAVGHHLLRLTLGAGASGASGAGVSTGADSVVEALGSWPTVVMSLAHLAAAVLVAMLLTRGEHALWALLAWLLPRLPGSPRRPEAAERAPVTVRGLSFAWTNGGGRRSRAPPWGRAATLLRPACGPDGPLLAGVDDL